MSRAEEEIHRPFHKEILSKKQTVVYSSFREIGMLARKKKATFYLPEDLLRVARVHAARTDRRDSQVVEEALRAYLGYASEENAWTTEVEPAPGSDGPPPAGGPPAPERPESPESPEPSEPSEPSRPSEPIRALEPLPPLDPREALTLAVAELHALRDESARGR